MVTARRKPGRQDASLDRIAGRRQDRGRRQPVPAIPEFAAALSEGHNATMIHHIVQFALRQRFLVLMLVVLVVDRGRAVLPAHARGRLSRSFSAAGGNHHAVAGPRRRGNRAAGDAADRTANERHAAHGVHALDLPLRPFRRHHDVRGKHRQLLRAPGGVRAAFRCQLPTGVTPQPGAAFQPLGPGLSLRDRKPGSQPAGTEDDSRTGSSSAPTNRCRAWRTIPASAAR